MNADFVLDTAARALQERDEWKARAELAERAHDALAEDLRFVERWANHHATKPSCTPQEALSTIQHYPGIVAITRSYADGKRPETPDPWAEARKWESAFDAVYDALQPAVTEASDSFGAKEELHETAARVLKERDALTSRLRAIEGQEPGGE